MDERARMRQLEKLRYEEYTLSSLRSSLNKYLHEPVHVRVDTISDSDIGHRTSTNSIKIKKRIVAYGSSDSP